jgi:hypothetical protein
MPEKDPAPGAKSGAAPPPVLPAGRPTAASPSLAGLLAAVDAECLGKRADAGPSRYDGDLILVSLKGREFGLFLTPRGRYQGPFFAELPSFFACIRGDSAMTPSEGESLSAYVKALARRDSELKEIFGI